MTQSEGKKWIDLFHQRQKLEGTKIFGLIRHLATSQYVLNGNYQELHNLIISYEQNSSILAVQNRLKLEAFHKEFLRLLHNYLASIFSLIEHTRKFCKELNNQELDENYQVDLENLKTNNCIRFLKDLRTYTQHWKLPFVSATFSMKVANTGNRKATIQQKLILHKNDLLEWKGWSQESKKCMEIYEEKIDLKLIIDEYQELIASFHKRLRKKVVELYSKQIKEFFEIESDLRKLQEHKSRRPT